MNELTLQHADPQAINEMNQVINHLRVIELMNRSFHDIGNHDDTAMWSYNPNDPNFGYASLDVILAPRVLLI